MVDKINLKDYMLVGTPLAFPCMESIVSRLIANLVKQHWQVVKWIFGYIKGTSHYCLCFGNINDVVKGYMDENMAINVNTRKLLRVTYILLLVQECLGCVDYRK